MAHGTRWHIENLTEGLYAATSDEAPGLVTQGRTIQDTIDIPRDAARELQPVQARRTTSLNRPGDLPVATSMG